MTAGMSTSPQRGGFGLPETVIAVGLVAFVLIGLAQAATLATRLVNAADLHTRAGFLAEEGIEAVRALRDTGWSVNIAPLDTTRDYAVVFSENAWRLVSAPQPAVDGRFDRRVRIANVYRDANDNIVPSGGTLDANTKQVTLTVSWSDRGRTASTTIATYLANLFSN